MKNIINAPVQNKNTVTDKFEYSGAGVVHQNMMSKHTSEDHLTDYQ